MNIFFREMKANRKSLIIWSIGLILMVAASMTKYGGITVGNTNDAKKLLQSFPSVLMAFFGMTGLDYSTAIGFYGVTFLFLLIMAGIHAGMLGANIIAKEEYDKTSEFLLAKPVSRFNIITQKLSAAIVNVIIINIVTLFSSIFIVNFYAKSSKYTSLIIQMIIGLLLFQCFYLFLGSAIAAISRRPKTSASIAGMILFAGYILSVIIDLSDKINFLKYLTPFKYFSANKIIDNNGVDPQFVVISIVLTMIFIYITYIFYEKRDMRI